MENTITQKRIALHDLFSKNISKAQENEHLLGSSNGMDAIDLVYLYNEIKYRYNVTMPEEFNLESSLSNIQNLFAPALENQMTGF
jgi:hypothetical protein